MASDQLGGRLIFLISQPRSGSTLLQRLLSAHPAIASLPEPWFMLHLLYGLRPVGVATEYNARNAYRGLSEFIAALPDGQDAYMAAVRAAAMRLYEAALRSSGKQLFLDKTPRYYLVIPELMEAFPEATFLFLVRNPLDVFSSIFEAHAGADWTQLARRDRFHDLITAPRVILEATGVVGGRKALIRYEDLVEQPEGSLRAICKTLGVVFDPTMLQYGPVDAPGRSLGDRRVLHMHERPVADYVAAWRPRLDTGWKRELALGYLRDLGPATVEGLGYEYRALEKDLLTMGSLSGSGRRRWRLISTPPYERSWRDSLRLATARSLHERGWLRTVLRVLYIAWMGRPPARRPDSGVID